MCSEAFKKCGKNGIINLDYLNDHNAMEHDNSLSRLDAYESNGKQDEFNRERFLTLLSFSKDGISLTVDDIADARIHFYKMSLFKNPVFKWDTEQEESMLVDTVLLLYVLGKDGSITIDDAKSFFIEETFPPNWKAREAMTIHVSRRHASRVSKLIEEKRILEKKRRIEARDAVPGTHAQSPAEVQPVELSPLDPVNAVSGAGAGRHSATFFVVGDNAALPPPREASIALDADDIVEEEDIQRGQAAGAAAPSEGAEFELSSVALQHPSETSSRQRDVSEVDDDASLSEGKLSVGHVDRSVEQVATPGEVSIHLEGDNEDEESAWLDIDNNPRPSNDDS